MSTERFSNPADLGVECAERAPGWAVSGVPEHPLRETLNNELHARPPTAVSPPVRVSHLALLSGDDASSRDRAHVVSLCRRFGAPEPTELATYWNVDLGVCRLNWERHTEFSTYTFYRWAPAYGQSSYDDPFRDTALDHVPGDWLSGLAGTVIVAVHLVLVERDAPDWDQRTLGDVFVSGNIAGSEVFDGGARVWTDFRLQADGFSRILVKDRSLGPNRLGRLVQRVLEIETYRMTALLSFPLAKQHTGSVKEAGRQLAELTGRMEMLDGLDAERELLGELSRLATGVEHMAAATNYRFGATRAYYVLVQRRVEELRETRLDGRQTIREFLDRRLAPAMRTCDSVGERLSVLSQRVSRTGDLLRTRVDVALESQNQDLLKSMNRRAQLQLRLQETVEGLSVVILSYYLVGLIGYVLKGAKSAGLALNLELFMGLSVPFVVAAVWYGIRRTRASLTGKHPDL